MQTLIIPETISISFLDKNNKPLKVEKILIGIRTFANFKNNVSLYPFLTDSNGTVTITSEEINQRFNNFVSYGIMDYSPLQTAKPNIEIYYWGKRNIEKHIDYWTDLLKSKNDLKHLEILGDKLGKLQKELAEIEKTERQELELFNNCFNRDNKILEDLTLATDTWDKPLQSVNYKLQIDMKHTSDPTSIKGTINKTLDDLSDFLLIN